MIQQPLRKVGDNYVVTIPREEVERLGLQEGQVLTVEIQVPRENSLLEPDLRAAFEESWARYEADYHYLAG